MRARILSEATRLFAARGVDATSLDRIAKAVGIRKPSLLYHFPSKADLHRAVIDELLARWRDVLPRLLMAAATGWERFDAILDEVENYFAADTARARVLLRELLDRPDGDADGDERFDDYLSPWLGMTAGYIQRGKKEGVIHPDVDPEVYVLLMTQTILATYAVSGAIGQPLVDSGYRTRFRAELKRIAHAALFRPRELPTSPQLKKE